MHWTFFQVLLAKSIPAQDTGEAPRASETQSCQNTVLVFLPSGEMVVLGRRARRVEQLTASLYDKASPADP